MHADLRSEPHTDRARILAQAHLPRLFTGWAVTLTALLAVLFLTVTAVTVILWLTDPNYTETTPVVDLGFFALGGILITVGLATQIRTPHLHVAGLQQSLVALLALAVAGYLGERVEPFIGSVLLLAAAAPLAVLHPSRGRLVAAGQRVHRPMAVMALIALIPSLAYASNMLDLARSAGPSCFFGQCVRGDRLAEMAALAVALVLVALLASLKTAGWTVPARTAGIAALILGWVSLALPGEAGALKPLWAAAALLWGASFIAIAHAEAHREVTGPRGTRAGMDPEGR